MVSGDWEALLAWQISRQSWSLAVNALPLSLAFPFPQPSAYRIFQMMVIKYVRNLCMVTCKSENLSHFQLFDVRNQKRFE
ncbi:hypothetical protein DM860_003694 [Cuscuta australis]|uniref:Uncharacterized protein n=1 Tax=Cuscuta australis TaxID=267555 RepID=A0A328DGK3_9ASTE|nr:hypothetical protein DM860_003694 [Cuscuta australis]